jgi:hypothetical protein
MCDAIVGGQTLKGCALEDGDIVCFQKAQYKPDLRYPTVAVCTAHKIIISIMNTGTT